MSPVSLLTIGLIVVGIVGLANLLILIALLQRLRENGPIGREPEVTQFIDARGLSIGTDPGHVDVMTVAGRAINPGDFPPESATLVGFFSPTCKACKDELPRFLEAAGVWPGGRERVLAVVVDDLTEAAPLAETLQPVANVVLDGFEGPLAQAYSVTAFPSFGVLGEGGRVLSADQVVAGVVSTLRPAAG